MTNDGTLDTTDTNGVTDTTAITDGANFALRPVSRRLLIGGGAALGVGSTALGLRAGRGRARQAVGELEREVQPGGDHVPQGRDQRLPHLRTAAGPELSGQLRADRHRVRLRQRPGHHRAAERRRGGGGPGAGRRSALRPDPRRDLHRRPAAAGVPRRRLHPRERQRPLRRTSSGWSAPRSATWPGRASPWPSWPGPPGSRATRPARCGSRSGSRRTRTRPTGLGGYTFGATAGLETRKSTEHNIDVAGFFRLIQTLTGQRVWRDRSDHAWAFVEQVWNDEDGFFWTGSERTAARSTSSAPSSRSTPQTWSWLVRRQGAYARGAGLGRDQPGHHRHPAAAQLGADRGTSR